MANQYPSAGTKPEERTPSQWRDMLENQFKSVTRPQWCDGRERPGRHEDPGSRGMTFSRNTTPRNQWLDTLWSYYVGDPPLPRVAEEYRDLFRDVLRKARSNYAPLCVAAMLDRMELQAVSTHDDDDTDGDDTAADIMDESGFAATFKEVLEYLFSMGESYCMAVPTKPWPTPHAIDPRRCIGIRDPQHPIRLIAALVTEVDELTNERISYLFLPGQKYEYRQASGTTRWELVPASDISDFEAITVPAELGGIPIVRFDNPHGLGEYEPHIDLLDRINDTTLQRIIGFWYQALRQRAVGLDEDDDDDDYVGAEDGSDGDTEDSLVKTKPFDWENAALQSGPGSLWKFPKEFEMWESQQTDFGPLINGKREDVKEFAGVSSTPLYLITPDDANGSALGAGLQRESATSKIRDRRVRITPGLKLLWRILFAFAGEQDRGRKMRFHWGPIEFRTLIESSEAASQSQGTLSTEDRCERAFQMSPDEIKRNMQRLTAERLLEASLQPPPATTQPGGVQPTPGQQAQQTVNEPPSDDTGTTAA